MEQRATQESIAARILAYSASFVDESLCATCLWMPSAPRGSAPEGRWRRCRSSTTPMIGELSCIVPLTTRLPLMTRGSQCYPPVSWTTQGPACRQRRGVDGYADQSTDMVLSRVHPGVRSSRAVPGLRLPGIPSGRASRPSVPARLLGGHQLLHGPVTRLGVPGRATHPSAPTSPHRPEAGRGGSRACHTAVSPRVSSVERCMAFISRSCPTVPHAACTALGGLLQIAEEPTLPKMRLVLSKKTSEDTAYFVGYVSRTSPTIALVGHVCFVSQHLLLPLRTSTLDVGLERGARPLVATALTWPSGLMGTGGMVETTCTLPCGTRVSRSLRWRTVRS